ncbi:MAG TPA: hypothetical protein VHZ07_00180 [Bryobacteraceae bacterium]|nr:hypothetical protein [Bryobacteraceae bacterium]
MGSRKQTQYRVNSTYPNVSADDSFEISVRNRKTAPVSVIVREHLYRTANWTISGESDLHVQRDSHTIEYPIDVAANAEKLVKYSVHYTW